MRIALRPSGGRGDYELAGSYNGLHASDLLNKSFCYQLTPSFILEGKAKAHKLHGKPRIRPEHDGRHSYVLIYSILLLPPPRRELIKTTKTELKALTSGDYILAGIDVDIVGTESEKVIFAPTIIWAKNQKNVLKVDFVERMAIVSALWFSASLYTSNLASLLLTHKSAIDASDHFVIQKTANEIQQYFKTEHDVIPLIMREFDLPTASDDIFTGIKTDNVGYETEENTASPIESKAERIKKWRKQADRGPGAREFSRAVREAYDYRCLFSGERFPKIEALDSAGVDGAHILPWSTYQINSVINGICLCKQCHWAFDNGLLRLNYDASSHSYSLLIPEEIEEMAIKENFDLAYFKKNTGVLDERRLPRSRELWPSPSHIIELNSTI
jgi:hypothetical protein